MKASLVGLATALVMTTTAVWAGTIVVKPTTVTEWKAVYGKVETRDTNAARARIGGSLVELTVSEGDVVKAGQVIALVKDDKIAFQIQALDAQIKALEAQLDNAETELQRGQTLVDKGVSTTQRLDQLRLQTDVARNQIAAAEAQRAVLVQQQSEGEVLAPADGRVLTVPVTRGAVLMAGESVATIGSGGYFLRLAIPERHAAALKEGSAIEIAAGDGSMRPGRLAKIYPEIDGGRVTADVAVDGLDTAFIGARLQVRVPVGSGAALLVPAGAVVTRHGLDFVSVKQGDKTVERAVVLGEKRNVDGVAMADVLTGLTCGEEVIVP